MLALLSLFIVSHYAILLLVFRIDLWSACYHDEAKRQRVLQSCIWQIICKPLCNSEFYVIATYHKWCGPRVSVINIYPALELASLG